jgi:hypothetical protein
MKDTVPFVHSFSLGRDVIKQSVEVVAVPEHNAEHVARRWNIAGLALRVEVAGANAEIAGRINTAKAARGDAPARVVVGMSGGHAA